MKKKTCEMLFAIPLAGTILRLVYDPMLGCPLYMENGLPKELASYMKAHPDVFITKKLLKEIMRGKAT